MATLKNYVETGDRMNSDKFKEWATRPDITHAQVQEAYQVHENMARAAKRNKQYNVHEYHKRIADVLYHAMHGKLVE